MYVARYQEGSGTCKGSYVRLTPTSSGRDDPYFYSPGRISPRVTIGALPDDVLLEIFVFCRASEMHTHWLMTTAWPRMWCRLVHVCKRWRYVVFASPNRLAVHILCTARTPVREMLNIWPPLPIQVWSPINAAQDNVIAALEHRDRICHICVYLTRSGYERFVTTMQWRFPGLTSLYLCSQETLPALPDTFLGGSAPCIQSLTLNSIPFPALPKLLLTSKDLVAIQLWRIPNSGYISPESMATGLSGLTRLRSPYINFELAASSPIHRRRSPLTRAALPSLTTLRFVGGSEYLEDLVARIDAPLFQCTDIIFFDNLILDLHQLRRFISHSGVLRSFDHAMVTFNHQVTIVLYQSEGTNPHQRLELGIDRRELDAQLSSMAQLCRQSLSLMSSVEQLDIVSHHFHSYLQGGTDNARWLELFYPFTAVRALCISYKLRPFSVSVLQELTGEMATEVLPALDNLYLEQYEPYGSEWRAIKSFIAARQSSSHPVSVHR